MSCLSKEQKPECSKKKDSSVFAKFDFYLIIIEHFLGRMIQGGNRPDRLSAEVDDRLPERLPGLVDERVRAAAEMRAHGEGRVEAPRGEGGRLQHAVEAVVLAVGELAPRLLVEGPLPLQREPRLVDDQPRQVQVDLRLRGQRDVRRHALHGCPRAALLIEIPR
jgi:hypothetical protein